MRCCGRLGDLSLMTTFLLVAACISAAAGFAAYRLHWIDRSPSLRLSLLAVNALAIAWLSPASRDARLMFASEHDLLPRPSCCSSPREWPPCWGHFFPAV
jgi:hypothetical protein